MPNLGTTELLIIAVVIMVLFGAKKLPDSARSLGRSMRIFKAETKGLRDDDTTTVQDATYVQTPVAPAAPIVPPAPVTPPAAQAKSPEQTPQQTQPHQL